MAVGYQFFRPVAYLNISGPSLGLYRVTLPFFVTILSCVVYLILPHKIDLVGDKSATDYLISFFSSLPGFFIAALAAVVAFAGGDLDKELPEFRLTMEAHGDAEPNQITLRVFLCFLFSYLTVLSFIGFFFCLGGALLQPNVGALVAMVSDPANAPTITLCLKVLFLAGISFTAASIVFCTLQGLYFLAERVHQTLL